MLRPVLFAALASVLLAPAAHAQRLGVEVEGGYFDMTGAKNTAKAVFDGSSGGFIYGLGVQAHLSHSFRLSLTGRRFSKDGERVFVADPSAEVFPLGHPLKIRTTPYALVGSYRFLPDSRLVPYIGAGVGVTSFKEESTVGGLETSDSETKLSIHAVAGVETGHGPIHLGIELQWFTVPSSAGVAGVSAVYGEKDVGGVSVSAKLRFSGGRR